jgi:hypothetical protein
MKINLSQCHEHVQDTGGTTERNLTSALDGSKGYGNVRLAKYVIRHKITKASGDTSQRFTHS